MPGDADERLDGPIEVGDRVWVANLQASGEVLAIHRRTAEADVQLGNFRSSCRSSGWNCARRPSANSSPIVSYANRGANVESPGIELDLRGARVEEGLEQVEKYLDNAYMARLPWVRIIHGKGTGALRDAIRESLKSHPFVGEFRAGGPGEGGDGVTVAKLMEQK